MVASAIQGDIARPIRFCRKSERIRGFTLHELMITLAIAAVLMTMSFTVSAMLYDTRLAASVNELLTSLTLARHESISRREPVTLCKTSDGQQCGRSRNWNQGWLVFVDHNHNGRVEPNETIIHVRQAQGIPAKIIYRGFPSHAQHYVTFVPAGLTNEHNGTFYFCDHRGVSETREIVLFKTGRARSVRNSRPDRARNCV